MVLAVVSAIARRIAIEGSRTLIERGQHREAVFWMAVTWSRCQQVFERDATGESYAQVREWSQLGYQSFLSDLGITSLEDIQQRREQVRALLPRVWAVAETIVPVNPDVIA